MNKISTETKKYTYLKLRVSLSDHPTKLYRIFLINENESLNTLGFTIMIAFNTLCYHYFAFWVGFDRDMYKIPSKYDDEDEYTRKYHPTRNSDIPIKEIFKKVKKQFTMTYDMGESYDFRIELVDKITKSELDEYPKCLKAVGYGILENDHGGFDDFLKGKKTLKELNEDDWTIDTIDCEDFYKDVDLTEINDLIESELKSVEYFYLHEKEEYD